MALIHDKDKDQSDTPKVEQPTKSDDTGHVGSLGSALLDAVGAKDSDTHLAETVVKTASTLNQQQAAKHQQPKETQPVEGVLVDRAEHHTPHVEPARPHRETIQPERVAPVASQNTQNTYKEEKNMSQNFGTYGLDDSYSNMDRTLGLNSGAVDVNEFKKQAESIIENDPASSKSGAYGKPMFLTLEAATLGLPCNALGIVMHAQKDGRRIPLLFTLLMESAEPLERRSYNMGNYSIQIASVTGDIFNDAVAQLINSHVQRVLNTKEQVLSAGVNVVPKSLDLKDPENTKYVRNLLFFALGALNTAADVRFGTQKFLSLVKPLGEGRFEKIAQTLHAQAVWGARAMETAAGLPIRSDVVLQTTIRSGNKATANLTQNVATRPVTALAAFIDLVYAPPRMDNNGQQTYASYGIPQNAKVVWFPRMVITRNRPMGKVINVGEMLLTLATSTVLGSNYNWINAFQPKRGVEDIHDIGALGYEHEFVPGQRAKIDTQDKSFNLPDFLNHTVEDNLLYSMDIEEAGDLTWMESALLACADKGPEGDAARAYIRKAADALTGGAFSRHFGPNDKIVANEVTRVHLGHYPDNDQLVDLRNIDHLAVLNQTGKNGSTIAQKWANAMASYNGNEALSLEEREKIIMELVPNATITGYANRITFNAHFLYALANAIAECGTTINVVEADRVARGDDRMAFSYANEFGQGAKPQNNLTTYGYSSPTRSNRGPAAPQSGNIWHGQ